MDSDNERPQQKVPTLVQLCQRAAASHVDALQYLPMAPYHLVKPILHKCNSDQLVRLEASSPHLVSETQEIWKDLCFRDYYLSATKEYGSDDVPQEPDTWKTRYFVLRAAEDLRLQEIGSKLRHKRMEEVERKREREVKMTDRLPPPKRLKTSGWGIPSQPKTLMQKTRAEAFKIKRLVYDARTDPLPTSSRMRQSVSCSSIFPSPSVSPGSASRVTVRTVVQKRPTLSGSKTSSSPVSHPVHPTAAVAPSPMRFSHSSSSTSSNSPPGPSISGFHATPVSTSPNKSNPPPRLPKPPAKSDPVSCLFMPKRKAHKPVS